MNNTPARSPGHLFINLWLEMEQVSPSDRACAALVSTLQHSIESAITVDSAATSAVQLEDLIQDYATSQTERIAIALTVMKHLDNAFLAIHPRALTNIPRAPVPEWLQEAEVVRAETGAFAVSSERRLIARGPLLRRERTVDASSADCLADRFAALAVVQAQTNQNGRLISISHRVISPSVFHGVPPGSRQGQERIAFLAVAQEANEIEIESKLVGDRHFVDYRASGHLDVVARYCQGLVMADGADIFIAPELMVCEEHADEICRLVSSLDARVRLMVMGSGHTRACDGQGMHWNEARVVNGSGATLWRQRKLWPASIGAAKAERLGIKSGDDLSHFEFNASGDTIEIVDVDGLGRCVVAICQDFEAEPLMHDIIQGFQPDWVFVPIFDVNVDVGRWAHQRTIAYSLSAARFLLCTNAAFSHKLNGVPPRTIALAVGPLDGADLNSERSCAPLSPDAREGTLYAEVCWGRDCPKWTQWLISASAESGFGS